jgi:YegS/Rv2252/BmrU family lipid kinase
MSTDHPFAAIRTMKSLLIVNPIAGQGRPHENLNDVESAFRSSVRKLVVTSGRGDAETAACEAAASGDYDEVLVAGGDGTINEAVNGLIRGAGDGLPSIPLGIIPQGTQNVLAQELGIGIGDLHEVASVFRHRRTRLIDVGEAGGRYFTLMAGFGFDAAVVGEVTRPIKELIGPAAYAFATLGALAKYRSTSVRLILDDEPVHSEAFAVVISNASSYAFRQIKLAPFAALDDGWLDICVFERPPFDKVGFATQMMAVIAGRHLRDPRVRYYRARRITIDSTPAINGQIDGDMFESTPVSISVVPKALRVYVRG